MIAPYKRPNFAYVASQLKPEQIEAALATAFALGFSVACEQIEDAVLVDKATLEQAISRGLFNAKWGQDEAIANLFHLGERGGVNGDLPVCARWSQPKQIFGGRTP